MKNRYTANETMKLLGKQYHSAIIDARVYAEIKDILQAHGFDNALNNAFNLGMMGVDIFMLGFIYGKRVERARKRNVYINNYNTDK